MAAIVQADPYQRLIRKIGYSIGLEEVVDRVKKLVELYVANKAVSMSAFDDLVVGQYKRQKTAAQHFRNFYSTLNLVRPAGRDLIPLYQLDSLSILRRLFAADDRRFDTASRLILTQCIIEEDGDIFLNGLATDFRAEEMRVALRAMVEAKRRQVTEDMRTPHLMSKIYAAIDIKNQSSPGLKGDGSPTPTGRFERRTAPLGSTRRTTELTPSAASGAVSIPDDYLGKASTTRKGWAEDLGFFKKSEKTEPGMKLLSALRKKVVSVEPQHSAVLFWGYRDDLEKVRSKLQVRIPEATNCEPWDLLEAIAEAFATEALGPVRSAPDAEEVITFLQGAFEAYREGNPSKGLIRNSLPMYVAEPVLAAWCAAERRQLPQLKNILEVEFAKPSRRRVQRMLIRGTAGALFFTR